MRNALVRILKTKLGQTKLDKASMVSLVATLSVVLFSADGSGAAAQDLAPVASNQPVATQFISAPVVQTLPQNPGTDDAGTPSDGIDADHVSAASLAQLVSEQTVAGDLPREIGCLAGAVYFEAKGETLPGQLAVARVVVARSKSGRFPDSYCGVVYQPSQFSFVRGNAMPSINHASAQWRNAVAIAQIAHGGSWQSPVEGALFFHAARVSPNWRLKRMARVDNHVFYR